MNPNFSLKQELESLTGYNDYLVDKYFLGLPSWAKPKKIKNEKIGIEENKRVMKRINELSKCKRHLGKYGLDCFICKLEGKF